MDHEENLAGDDDTGASGNAAESSMEDTIRAAMHRGDAADTIDPAASMADAKGPTSDAKSNEIIKQESDDDGKDQKASLKSSPPSSWRAEAALEWSAIPAKVQAEIQRREDDFHRGVEQYKAAAEYGKTFEREIAPYEAVIRADGVEPQQVVRNLLTTAYKLRTGTPAEKVSVIQGLAKHYGVDLTQTQPDHATDPNLLALQQQIHHLTTQMQTQQQTALQAQQMQIQQQIKAFSEDESRKEYFPLIRDKMAGLLESGLAQNLQEAYDQAIYLVPAIRERIQAEQFEKQAKIRSDKAIEAKRAAKNAIQKGQLPAIDKPGSLDETIRAELRKRA